MIQVGDRELRVRAVRVKSERLRDKIDDAYGEKYDTKASQKYVRGLRSPPPSRYHYRIRPALTGGAHALGPMIVLSRCRRRRAAAGRRSIRNERNLTGGAGRADQQGVREVLRRRAGF